jgi:AraC family transcriptional regulator
MNAKESKHIYRRRMNRVIDHIRDHLTEPLPLASLARLAHFSPFHFHRIFRSLAGEPLHTFIRRLRVEKAVLQMSHGPKATLTEVALGSGFASSSDFSRAFKQLYGFPPRFFSRERFLQDSKIRQDLLANAGYGFGNLPLPENPDNFRVRLVDQPSQAIAYERVIGSFDVTKLMAGFDRLMTWGRKHGLVPSAQLIGRPLDDLDITPMSRFRFDWCLVLPPNGGHEGDVSFGRIPASRCAVVRCHGDIHKEDRAWKYLFHAWLPKSGYQPTHDPTLEVYRSHPEVVGWETFDMDCCLPVKPLKSR